MIVVEHLMELAIWWIAKVIDFPLQSFVNFHLCFSLHVVGPSDSKKLAMFLQQSLVQSYPMADCFVVVGE